MGKFSNEMELAKFLQRSLSRFNSKNTVVDRTLRRLPSLARKARIKKRPEEIWIESNFENGTIHDQEYRVFLDLCNVTKVDLIIDIGANYGYSISTLVSLGYSGKFLSLEPLSIHKKALQRVRDILGEKFNYKILAISDCNRKLLLYTPTVNHVRLTALTFSGENPPNVLSMSHNILNDMNNQNLWRTKNSIFLESTATKAKTLDSIFESGDLGTFNSLGIKIDVEGHELNVLKGALKLLTVFRPTIILEKSSNRDLIDNFLTDLEFIKYSNWENPPTDTKINLVSNEIYFPLELQGK